MDDLGVPMNDQQPMPQQDSNGLYRRPSAYQAPPPQPAPEPQQAPVAMNYNPAPPPPPVMAYVPMPSPPPVYYVYPRPVVPIYVPRRPVIIARYGYPY